jgi:hypothetical protein
MKRGEFLNQERECQFFKDDYMFQYKRIFITAILKKNFLNKV